MQKKKIDKDFLKLSLGSLGIVFGDLGTSPLYTLKECFSPAHGLPLSQNNILGILSLIFWSIMIVVVLKYIIFILRADNQGEGGIMSLLSLIIPSSKSLKFLLPVIIIGLFGTSLLLADGIITPAITVLGAIEGLELATPVLKPFVIPVTIGILAGLFLAQKKGTEKIGNLFGILMVLWFMVIGILGLIYITKAPQVLAAINPYFAFDFFSRNGIAGFLVLGSVVLAVTGTEALYADIGHFGKSPIKFSFITLVMPSLVLNYFGQGAAVLMKGSEAITNPFYYICPKWFLYPLIVISTVAAIIASQALISGAFSLVQQAMQLGYLPKLQILHTSENVKGQIYIPFVNYSLMFACILLVILFKSSSSLASAYGISVMGTMLCTTILFYILTVKVWKWSKFKAIPLFIVFILVDLSFLGANIGKIATGGWFPLMFAVLFYIIMRSWKKGITLVNNFISVSDISLKLLIDDISHGEYAIQRVQGNAVFIVRNLKNLGLLLHHIKHNKVLHKNIFLLSVKFRNVPYINSSAKIKMKDFGEGFYSVSINYGYMEQPNINDFLSYFNGKGFDLKINQISFYLERISIAIYGNSKMANWQKKIFAFMHRNAAADFDYYNLPPGCVVELGTKVVI